MGASAVKLLLKHLRERQETFGVNAFHFDNVYRNKTFQPAKYPKAAEEVIAAGPGALTWPKPDNPFAVKTDTPDIRPQGSPTLPTAIRPTITPEIDVHQQGNPTFPTPTPATFVSESDVSFRHSPTLPIATPLTLTATTQAPSRVGEGRPTPMLDTVPQTSPNADTDYLTDTTPPPICRVNIDASLVIPEGDPFAHLRNTSFPPTSQTIASGSHAGADLYKAGGSFGRDLRFIPPKFSPFTTPKKQSPSKRNTADEGSATPKISPSKRKRADFETTTPTRSGRTIKRPKRFGQE